MILWVDDNDELRHAVAEHLAAAGHRVVEAGSTEEALAVLGREPETPGLLLTDLRLPGRSGLQLAESLRSRLPDLPVLLVTSHATPSDLDAWSDDPAFAVLHKPFDMARLEAAVSALLAGERPTSSAAARADAPTPLPFAADPPNRGQSQSHNQSHTQSPPWLRLALVAAVTLAIVGGAWSWIAPGGAPPELPDTPPVDDVRRGGTIQTLEPFGPLASAPSAFRWRPATNADHYRLHVEDVAGTPLWQGETDGVELAMPPELAERLLPLAAYYWRVEALDADRRTTATSDPVRFRIVEPETPRAPTSVPTADPDSDSDSDLDPDRNSP